MIRILFIITMFFATNTIIAQDNLSIKEIATAKTEKLNSDIGLYIDQVDPIIALYEELETTNQSINNDESFSDIQKRELISSNNSTELTKLQLILTNDQLTKYKFLKSTRNLSGGVKKIDTKTKSRN